MVALAGARAGDKPTTDSRMRIKVGAATDVGRVRKQNEDAFALAAEQGLLVVCDGMGGAAFGEVASQLAITAIMSQLNGSQEAPASPTAEEEGGYLPRTSQLAEAVRSANKAIFSEAQNDEAKSDMGTTVVAAWVEGDIASVAHVGDSRAYLWRNDHFESLTRDHSFVEEQVKAGVLDRAVSLQSEHQNILLRALGREPVVDVDVSEVPVQPGDYLLLCSDGLTRMVPEAVMSETIAKLRDPQAICSSLVDAANLNGGADNVTVVVAEIQPEGWRRWLSV
jgi:PPM family protein phosphatase